MANAKKFAKIEHYGKLLVPFELLEKIVAEGYMVETSYGEKGFNAIEPISKVEIYDSEDVKMALAQKNLQE
jgi:hypothetical protein